MSNYADTSAYFYPNSKGKNRRNSKKNYKLVQQNCTKRVKRYV